MIRRLLALTASASLILTAAVNAPTASATTDRGTPSVTVAGAVATPATYTPDQLAALGQVTLPDLRNPFRSGREVTGTSLQSVVAASAPILPTAKNAQLRVTLTVSGRGHHPVALTLGELDPNNGNHPALLVPALHGRHKTESVDLVIPGDLGFRRTVRDVSGVEVAVAAPTLPSDLPAGAIRVAAGPRTVILTADELGRLPTVTRDVAFLSGQGPQTHTETGPTLAAVLRAAGIRTTRTSTVAAIAGDGYVATVTPGEATSGRRTLLLSTIEDKAALPQPRLVTDGDVYGGRYVTGVLGLEVTATHRCHRVRA